MLGIVIRFHHYCLSKGPIAINTRKSMSSSKRAFEASQSSFSDILLLVSKAVLVIGEIAQLGEMTELRVTARDSPLLFNPDWIEETLICLAQPF